MYRAIYDYQGNKKDETLTIKAGELLAVIDKTNKDWWKCQRLSSGSSIINSAGYVPVTYIAEVKVSHDLQVELKDASQALLSIDRAIEATHARASQHGGNYTAEMRENLLKLTQHRRNFVASNSALASAAEVSVGRAWDATAPVKASASSSSESSATSLSTKSSSKKTSVKGSKAPLPPSSNPRPRTDTDTAKFSSSNTPRSSGPSQPPQQKAAPLPRGQQSAPPPPPGPQKHGGSGPQQNAGKPLKEQENSYHQPDPHPLPPSQSKKPGSVGQGSEGSASDPGSPHLSPSAQVAKSPGAQKILSPTTLDKCHVPESTGQGLVENLRKNTALSYEMSKVAATCVLQRVAASVPETAALMARILDTLPSVQDPLNKPMLHGHDYERLKVIIEEMTSCKDDSQQRSWALYEDQSIISEYLNELITLLTDADPAVSKEVIKEDHCKALDSLVSYYQMEPRVDLRMLLLKVFGAVCELSADFISHLLNTILPMELARDMTTDTANSTKLSFSTLLVVMLLSQGEALPYTHYEHLNESFIHTLLDWIENHTYGDNFSDLCVSLILAFNLHFVLPEDNYVMKVLAQRKVAKIFSEKLLLLVNSQEDPVKLFDHKPLPPNSMMKLLADIFSSETTSGIFYTNDLKVLIDIIIRQLSDLPAGDQMRTENLSLIYDIIKCSSYRTDRHRFSELWACLEAIVAEEGTKSDQDKDIVRKILTDFSQYFSQK